ncbi:MAG: glycosyltransferase [bacterium]
MKLDYVLITPAYNEEAFIEKTIRSVVKQTILPKKWVIVSDGSTDRTDKIVKSYAEGKDWMEFIRITKHSERNFAAKVQAFNIGYEKVKSQKFDVIGSLDADISFGEDFFEYLLDKFEKIAELGVAGTHYIEGTFHSFKDSYINVHHVNGGCQMFKRQCFDDIGGYMPIKSGGIDWIAVTTARMKGWKTHSFADRMFIHHRKIGTADNNEFSARFHYGKKDYFLGSHPLWEILRSIFQMTKKPYIIGGFFLFLGYSWSWLTGVEQPISRELIEFYRKEQMQRLKELLTDRLRLNR